MPAAILISEVLPGIHAIDNNLEFIELHNTGPVAVDLNGWSLWYRMTDSKSELYNGTWQIKPRFQTDFAEIFPPELTLELDVHSSILPGETLTFTLTAFNHTVAPLTNVRIEAAPPVDGVELAQVLDGGEQEGPTIAWVIPELAGGGTSASVSYVVTVDADATDKIVAESATAAADQWYDPVETDRLLTFVGSGVPTAACGSRAGPATGKSGCPEVLRGTGRHAGPDK